DVQRLLDDGVGADLGSETWNAIAHAADVLTHLPLDFGPGEIQRLRAAGLDDADIVDVINGAAFFHWANRLMLSLGAPEFSTPRQERSSASPICLTTPSSPVPICRSSWTGSTSSPASPPPPAAPTPPAPPTR